MTDGAANTVDLEFEQAADLIELYTRLGKHADARKAATRSNFVRRCHGLHLRENRAPGKKASSMPGSPL